MTIPPVHLASAAALVLTLPLLTREAAAADLAAPRPPAAVASYADWSGGYLGLEGSAGGSYGAYSFGPTTIGGRWNRRS
jgi:high affinity Mn2+ porin